MKGAEPKLALAVPFLVESYVAAYSAAFDDACERARLTAQGARGVRYVDTTAGPQFERIVPAVSDSAHRRKEIPR